MAQDFTWNKNNIVEEPILTEYNEITTLLKKPVKDKRRIKYTCFDISSSYIALGSNSGSVYLFARETCVFQQLIPLSNGAVDQILISPDEKAIALSTDYGNICMVVFKPSVKEAVISSVAERNGERATNLCWNDNSNELYIGGANGTVHVMGLSIFTVKRGIFQNPACPIMGLDYKVVQMDFSSPLLLVSTISDCYICDTVQGQYEKVGVRTRQGEFGACFYKPDLGREFDVQITEEEKFSQQGNSEFEETEIYENDKQYPRIYCARPGSRLWEAKPNGKIVKTHNFKEALAIPPTVVRKLRDETINSSFTDTTDESFFQQLKSLKFSSLHIIANEYLFTYNTNALYILDPIKSVVVLWCNDYVDIKIGKVIDNKIYLMRKSCDFHCLELRQINQEKFHTTKNKSLNKVNNSSLVVVNKISNEFNNKGIKSLVSTEIERKNDEGNNLLLSEFDKDVRKMEINEDENLVEDNLKLYKSKKLYDKTVLDLGNKINFYDNVEKKSSQIINEDKDIEKESKDKIKNLLTDVQNIYYLANSIKIEMSDNEIDTILINVKETLKCVEKSYENLKEPKPNVFKAILTAEQYYRTIFLSKLSKRGLNDTTNDNIFDEIIVSFLKINGSEYSECECGFPYYNTSVEYFLEPKFIDVGLSIIERYSKNDKNICLNLCKKVPYMWRIYLKIIDNYLDDKIFAQLLQTRDELILSFILISLNPKQWEFVKKLINNLENERCLICSKSIKENDKKREEDKNLSINWNNVANEIMKRKGSEVAVDFLEKLNNELPSVSLNQRIFESLIFTKILKNHGLDEPIDFNNKLNIIENDIYSSLCCPKVQDQLINTLAKDLQTEISMNKKKTLFGTKAHHWGIRYDPKNSICPCCTLPLKTPVLLENNGITLFKCGHLYHVNCLVQKNIIKCNLNHN